MSRARVRKPAGRGPSPRGGAARPLAAAVLGFLLYVGTLSHGYVLDDDVITRRNAFVARGVEGIPDILTSSYLYGFNRSVDLAYRPVPLAATALEVECFGANPTVHHLGNLLLYALVCATVVWSLDRILGPGYATVALLAGLLFAAHPVHTEVVANIKGRDELWATFWGLLSLGLLWSRRKATLRSLALAGGAYFLAVCSKETAYAIFPISLVLLGILTRPSLRKLAAVAAGYAGVTLLSLGVRWAVSRKPGLPAALDDPINNVLLAAHGWEERLATQAVLFAHTVRLLIFPKDLSFDYSVRAVEVATWKDPAALLGAGLFLGCLAAAGILLARLRRSGKTVDAGPGAAGIEPSPSAVAAAFLLLTGMAWLPGSNLLFLTGATLAERFLFLPSLGVAVLLALGLARARALTLAAGLLILLGGVKTVARAAEWKSNDTLFQAALRTQPQSARVQHHAASRLREQGEAAANPGQRRDFLEAALQGYDRALDLHPEFAEASYNRGVTLAGLGRTADAEAAYRRTLELEPEHPDALNNLGVFSFQRQDAPGAEAWFARAVASNPYHALAWVNLGTAILAQGDPERARETLARGLTRLPDEPALLRAMVDVLTRQGDEARARLYRDRLASLGSR